MQVLVKDNVATVASEGLPRQLLSLCPQWCDTLPRNEHNSRLFCSSQLDRPEGRGDCDTPPKSRGHHPRSVTSFLFRSQKGKSDILILLPCHSLLSRIHI